MPTAAAAPMRMMRPAMTCPATPRPASTTMVSWIMRGPCHNATLAPPGWRNWSDAPDLKSGAHGHAGSSPAPAIVEPLSQQPAVLERPHEDTAAALLDVERSE